MEHIIRAAEKLGYRIDRNSGRPRLIRKSEEDGLRFTANIDPKGNGSVSRTLIELPFAAYAPLAPLRSAFNSKQDAIELRWIDADGDRPNLITGKRTFSGTDIQYTQTELNAYFDELIRLQRTLTQAQVGALIRLIEDPH